MTDDKGRIIKAFYEALTPAKVQECEQFYAHGNEAFATFIESVRKDLEIRESAAQIHDDSVQYSLIHMMLTSLMMRSPNDFQQGIELFAAAILKLARAPRAISDPLAHLESEYTEGEQK